MNSSGENTGYVQTDGSLLSQALAQSPGGMWENARTFPACLPHATWSCRLARLLLMGLHPLEQRVFFLEQACLPTHSPPST
jgi:hypothetical protein